MTTSQLSQFKSKKRIYLDNNATTPLDPAVLDSMLEDLSSHPHNPSSIHYFGQKGKKLLIKSRANIADFLSVKPSEILFSSGGTESLNFLIRGLYEKKSHILTTDLEHPAIFHSIRSLEKHGAPITYLSPGLWGTPTPEQINDAIKPSTRLIVLSAVNSETGIKLDLENIAALAKKKEIPLIIDGVALLGKEPFTFHDGITAMAFSAHKIHGPKGIGFSYLNSRAHPSPLIYGGGQEYQLRSGTENLSGILGLSTAITILKEHLKAFSYHMRLLQEHFEKTLFDKIPDSAINGKGPRIVNTTNISFLGLDGETLLMNLDRAGIAASHGSACSAGSLEPSRVLLNMGLSKERAHSAIRFSFSRMNTLDEINHTLQVITHLVHKQRETLYMAIPQSKGTQADDHPSE